LTLEQNEKLINKIVQGIISTFQKLPRLKERVIVDLNGCKKSSNALGKLKKALETLEVENVEGNRGKCACCNIF